MLEFVYDFLSRNETSKLMNSCNFCEHNINDVKYSFKIMGSGKHDNKIICYDCMKQKFDNRKKIIVMK